MWDFTPHAGENALAIYDLNKVKQAGTTTLPDFKYTAYSAMATAVGIDYTEQRLANAVSQDYPIGVRGYVSASHSLDGLSGIEFHCHFVYLGMVFVGLQGGDLVAPRRSRIG